MFVANSLSRWIAAPAVNLVLYLLDRSDALSAAGLEVLATLLGVGMSMILGMILGFLLPPIFLFVGVRALVRALVCVIAPNIDGSDLPS
jgi:hypothetical protein